jgi:tetratricopeptide (TPR) repeat protein
VQQLVLFPVAELDPLAWLLAGVVLAATPDPSGTRRVGGDRGLRGTAVVVACTVGAVLLVVDATSALVADRALATATAEAARGDHLAAVDAADRATDLRPWSIDGWYAAAGIAAAGPSLLDLDAALARMEAGLARSPRDPALLDRREQLLVERAQRSGLIEDLDRAEAAVRDRIAVDPANPAHHRRLGLVLLARGDGEGAAAASARALDLDPDDPIARRTLDTAPGTQR